MNVPLVLLNRRRRGSVGYNPAGLFALNEPGIWLDPSDVANLDWRRNLLTYTEQFDNAIWTKSRSTITANASTAPDGTMTADLMIPTAVSGTHRAFQLNVPNVATQTWTLSSYLKPSGYNNARLMVSDGTESDQARAIFNLTDGTIINEANNGTTLSLVSSSATAVGSGWYRCSITVLASSAEPFISAWVFSADNSGTSFTGDGVSGTLVWGAQLELGSVATDYQRISDVNTEVLERFPRTTMFQDRAGSTAVTTPGQSVGYRRDKSGRNNHAVANSDAARGIYGIEPLGGRRNLLLNTTTMATQNVTVTAVAHTLSFTGTGTVTLSGVSTAGPLVGTGANDRVSLTFTPTAGTLTLTVSGSVTLAQLQIGSAFDAYQRVGTTQYDVTEAGKQTLHYVQYDGSDDGYVTPTITPGIDKVQVFAGVRKLSDAGEHDIIEHGIAGTNPLAFTFASGVNSPVYRFSLRGGGAEAVEIYSGYAAPNTAVVSGQLDYAGATVDAQIVGRINGANVSASQAGSRAISTAFGNYPLYIGRRGGTTNPFNGRDYGICVRFGANLDAATISATENYMAQKTGVTL